LSAGLVDEYFLFVAPIVIGGGKPFLPVDCVSRKLRLPSFQ
jgi:riboflavin biosynthesis pyrimidine reductase